ncbi:MFS transporter [Herbiconiux sp. VKM Ac-1786]|uniref:MFS transporter n=1 Tax=Herbiconiux sp. VKM Ac-1786 TaxID=2783824 RepID=UPI00188B809B|nr:MFS transporter [Herbiconiux sp. VKM Ac-1786]MBF4571868.1 MFS transporter [Herbiconiux sp. VKM Ac-1786]
MTASTTTTVRTDTEKRELRKVLWSAWLGTAIEFYDFALYTAMATLVLGPLFFNNLDPLVATIASLSTLALGYIVRPLGAIIFGHFGDRLGRKVSLVVTMLLMGGATTAIGLLPTLDQIGQLAPILLIVLRILQGIGVGGEWGGAALMAYEHAPKERRGFAGSVVNAGTPAGVVLASGVLALFLLLPADQFNSWGWRVPFLLSALLVVFALWIRLKVSESPVFLQEVKENGRDRVPLLRVLKSPFGAILTLLVAVSPFVYNSLVNSFGLLWAVEGGQLQRSDVLFAQTIAALANIPLALFFGWLSDRVGRKLVIGAGMVGAALYSMVFLLLLQSGNLGLTVLAYVGAVVFMAAMFGPISAFISELFSAKARYTGASLGYQLASTIGGLAPAIFSSFLVAGLGQTAVWVSAVMLGMGLLSLIFLLIARPYRTVVEPAAPASVPVGA